jgi:quercetin dioxygenase-like cupin family protein
MKVHELVARFAKAAESADATGAAREALEALRGDLDAAEQALSFVSGVGGNARQVFYRSPSMTLLKVCFPSGRRTPPHDHGTWAQILLLSGEEKNTLYRNEHGKLRRASEVTLTRGSILPMRADTAHVAECIGGSPAIGLHVYGGDILELPRRMWNPQTLEVHALDWGLYEQFAQAASKAAGAPVTES